VTTIADVSRDAARDVPGDLSSLVLPDGPEDVAMIQGLNRTAARQYLVRLLRLLRKLVGSRGHFFKGARLALAVLEEADLDYALRLALRPDITAWIWRAEAADAKDASDLDRLLAALLVGDALYLKVVSEAALDSVAKGSAVVLWPQRVRILGVGGQILVGVHDDSAGMGVSARSADGSCLETVVVSRVSSGMVGPEGVPPTSDFVVLDPRDQVIEELAGYEDPMVSADAGQPGFVVGMQTAVDFLDNVWPAGARAVRVDVQAVGRLGGHWGGKPLNFSVHGYRGLVLSSLRRPYKLAQTLVHEAGHNRFSHVTDCYQTSYNGDVESFSPFVGTRRPINHLLHGIISFVNDVCCAARSRTFVPESEKPGLNDYIEVHWGRLQECQRNLRATINPTMHGEQLLAGIDRAVDLVGDLVG